MALCRWFLKDHKTRKFDSDSNVFESTNSEEFFDVLEESIENKKIVIVAIDNSKISEGELMKYERELMEITEKNLETRAISWIQKTILWSILFLLQLVHPGTSLTTLLSMQVPMQPGSGTT